MFFGGQYGRRSYNPYMMPKYVSPALANNHISFAETSFLSLKQTSTQTDGLKLMPKHIKKIPLNPKHDKAEHLKPKAPNPRASSIPHHGLASQSKLTWRFLKNTPIMENQMEKKMENEMEAGII